MPYNEYGNKSTFSILKWIAVVIGVLAFLYLAFFVIVGKAVVGTVTG